MNLCHCLWTPSRSGGFRRSFVIARLACFFAPLSRVRTSSRDPSLYAFHRVLARSLQQVEQFCSAVSKRASSMQCARFSLHSDRPLYTCWIMGSRERISRCVNAFGRNGNANTMYPTATRPSAHSGCERSSAASAISSSQSCRNDPACRGSDRPCLRVIAAGPISAARGSTVAVRCLSLQR